MERTSLEVKSCFQCDHSCFDFALFVLTFVSELAVECVCLGCCEVHPRFCLQKKVTMASHTQDCWLLPGVFRIRLLKVIPWLLRCCRDHAVSSGEGRGSRHLSSINSSNPRRQQLSLISVFDRSFSLFCSLLILPYTSFIRSTPKYLIGGWPEFQLLISCIHVVYLLVYF